MHAKFHTFCLAVPICFHFSIIIFVKRIDNVTMAMALIVLPSGNNSLGIHESLSKSKDVQSNKMCCSTKIFKHTTLF